MIQAAPSWRSESGDVTVSVHRTLSDALRDELRAFFDTLPPGVCGEHDPRWLDVFADALRHQPLALIARARHGGETSPRGKIVGYLPLMLVRSRLFGRFLVSLPYVNRAGIVAHSRQAANALLDGATQQAAQQRVQYLELRHHTAVFDHAMLNHQRDEKVRMVLGLPDDADQLWSAIKSKVRNQIRKGDKFNLELRRGGFDLLHAFYHVFATNMRDLGTPVFPRRLFANILRLFPGEAELAVVTQAEQPVAAALLWHDHQAGQRITQVPSASSLRSANHTNCNMWMYHQLLLRAIERGSTQFDFGRSSPDSGTWRFKKQWGAAPQPTTWQYHLRFGQLNAARPDNPKYRRRIEMWQRLPVWVTKVVGPPIVRGIP